MFFVSVRESRLPALLSREWRSDPGQTRSAYHLLAGRGVSLGARFSVPGD